MKEIKKIIIYGCGQRGRGLYTLLKNCRIDVEYVIDTDEKKWNKLFYDIRISSPQVLLKDYETPVCIAIAKEEDAIHVREQLRIRYAVSQEREIRYFDLIRELFQIEGTIQNALKDDVHPGRPGIFFECDYGLGLGGIEAWTKSICRELVLGGRENINIISDSGEYDIPAILEDRVVRLPINHDEMFGADTMTVIVRYLLGQLPCVVVTGQFYVTLLAACLVKQHYPDQIHIISVIHFGQEELYRQYASVREYIDLYIGVSRDIIEGLIRNGIDKNRTEHMTCPVDCDITLERSYTTSSQMPIRLGFAGRVNAKQKRMDLVPQLIEALGQLGVNYYFEIAGEGDYVEKLNKYIEGNRLENRIRLVGKLDREEIGVFWRDKDLCISLSDYEGRSLSVMEAMANGAVPIVTATSGVREDIADGETGYIVGIRDIGAVAQKICYMEQHREKVSIMGSKAHACICSKCQMKEHLKYWNQLLDKSMENFYR